MSKYKALTDYLLANCNKSSVQLSFDSINSLIYPQILPFSAYMYREWWANDGYHSQANAWYNASFFVSSVSLGCRTVVFENSDTQRSPVTNFARPHIKNIACPLIAVASMSIFVMKKTNILEIIFDSRLQNLFVVSAMEL